MAPGVQNKSNSLSHNRSFHSKSSSHKDSHTEGGINSEGRRTTSDILLLNEKDLCQCDCSHSISGGVGGGERNVSNSGKNRKLTPSVSFRDGVELMTSSSSSSSNAGRHNGMIVRRNSTLSSYTSSSSCMSSRSSTVSSSDASSIYCESIFGGSSSAGGSGYGFEYDDDDSKVRGRRRWMKDNHIKYIHI